MSTTPYVTRQMPSPDDDTMMTKIGREVWDHIRPWVIDSGLNPPYGHEISAHIAREIGGNSLKAVSRHTRPDRHLDDTPQKATTMKFDVSIHFEDATFADVTNAVNAFVDELPDTVNVNALHIEEVNGE